MNKYYTLYKREKFIGKIMTGEEFTDRFPDLAERLVFLTEDENENTQLKIQKDFCDDENPVKYLNLYGIHFTDDMNLRFRHDLEYMKYYIKVSLPKDCNILINKDEFIADKIILGDGMLIKDLDIWKDANYCMKRIKEDPNMIMYVSDPNKEMQMIAVKRHPYLISYIPNPDKDTQKAAVLSSHDAIRYIRNPDEEIQKIAILTSHEAIKYINNPSDEIKAYALRKDIRAALYINDPDEHTVSSLLSSYPNYTGELYEKNIVISEKIKLELVSKRGINIGYIRDPSEEIQLAAVKQNIESIRYIGNPTENVQIYAVSNYPMVLEYLYDKKIHVSDKVILAAVERDVDACFYIEGGLSEEIKLIIAKRKPELFFSLGIFPSEEMQLMIIKKNPKYIKRIPNPSISIKIEALKKDHTTIEYIKDPTEFMEWIVVKKDPSYIEYVKNPSNRVQLAAVQKKGLTIQMIYMKKIHVSEEVKLEAVKEIGYAIIHIPDPSEEIQLAAVRQNGRALYHIYRKNIKVSEIVQLEAIKQYRNAIRYIDNPSEEVQLASVKQHGTTIKYIYKKNIDVSVKVQLAAVMKDKAAINFIENPHESVVYYCKMFTISNHINSLDSYFYQKSITGYEFKKRFPELLDRLIITSSEYDKCEGLIIGKYTNYNKIYFTLVDKLDKLCEDYYFPKYYRDVTLPYDCNISVISHYLVADKIILGKKKEMIDLDVWKDKNFCLNILEKNYRLIKYITDPCESAKLIAVTKNGLAIRYFNDKNNISENIYLAAVRQNGFAIRFIRNPSKEVQLEAVKYNGFAIGQIHPTNIISEEVKLAAVMQKGSSIKCIRSINSLNSYFDKCTYRVSEDIKLAAVKQDGLAIYFIFNPSEAVQLAAVAQNGLAIRKINKKKYDKKVIQISEEVKLEAVKQNGLAIRYIKDPSQTIQIAAIEQNISSINLIKNPCDIVKQIKRILKH